MNGKNSLLIASVAYLVLGLILLFFPGLTTSIFCFAVGALLLFYGIITIVSFFVRNSGGSFSFQAELILGVIAALVGLFFLIRPTVILSVLPFILGLYIFIDGLVSLKRGLDMRSLGYLRWKAPVVLAVVSLILGGVILWNPFGTHLLLMRMVGGAFLYQGASDLWSILTLNRLFKSME